MRDYTVVKQAEGSILLMSQGETLRQLGAVMSRMLRSLDLGLRAEESRAGGLPCLVVLVDVGLVVI